MLVSCENVAFGYGDNSILNGVELSLNEGERVGLIGSNGEGKTTLIKLILGELTPDSGKITLKNGLNIGYLAQNGGYSSGNTVFEEMKTVFSEDFSAVRRLGELSSALSAEKEGSAEYIRLSAKLNALTDFINSRGSFDAEIKIKTVLNGMGFANSHNRIIDSMSGGEKTRLKLARLLLEAPELLILDEPTNHLDIPTLFWLEEYLSSFKGAVLVVSHDRYFLDRLCARILELENRTISSFKGNYTKYKQLKAERDARLLKEYEAQREEIAKEEEYIAKNIVRATTAKSAQSRVKKLERTEILKKPYTPPPPPVFRFTYGTRPYENVLTVKGLNLRAGDKELLREADFSITRGRKVALVGENGTGKTTLAKAVFGGARGVELGRFVSAAMFDQEGLDLNPENDVLSELWERHVGCSQTEIRSALARCGLGGEDVFKKVKNLSGGERAKLALCILESEYANFLILDEPTNHLDLPARESLERALTEYDGTLLFVSHDRYFISAIADEILEIEGGKLNMYEGGYESYIALKNAAAKKLREQEEAARISEKNAKRAEGYRSAKERAEEARRREKIKATEKKITELEAEQSALENELCNPAVSADYKKVAAISARLGGIKEELDALYSEYSKLI